MSEALTSSAISLRVLRYLAPIITVLYWILARTISACLLQRPLKRAATKNRRRVANFLQLLVVTAIAAAGVTTIDQSLRHPDWDAGQDLVINLVLSLAVHACLTLDLIETQNPLWHPYLGSYLVSLAFELTITILIFTQHASRDQYASTRFSFNALRSFLFALLSVLTAFCVLSDRRKVVRLDDESEALLTGEPGDQAPGTTNGRLTKPPLTPPSTSSGDGDGAVDNDSDDDDDDIDDSDTEDPEADKAIKAQGRKRLEESGSWMTYLKDFKIFIPMLLPWQDRVVQACLIAMGFVIAAQRVLNILVPRQLGIVVNELSAGAGTGNIPWRSIGLWTLFSALDSSVGVVLVKQLAELRVRQFGFKAICTHSFRHIMGLDTGFHNSKNSGELIRTVEQGANLQDLVDYICFDVLPTLFDLVAAFVYIYFLFDVYVALIPFAVGILYIWLGTKTTKWSVKYRRDYNTAWREESRVQNEAINNWQTVSQFNRAEYESARYSDKVDDFNNLEWQYYLIFYLGGALQSLVMLVGRLSAAILAARSVALGRAPVGNFVTLISYLASVEQPMMEISYSVRKISGMLTDSERLLQLFLTKPAVSDTPGATELQIKGGECEFKHVAFAYDPRKSILQDVSFKVEAGQTVALVGETGGGKSTILKLLYRDFDINSGSICIDGQDIRDVTLDSLRDSFGLVPQDPSLFNMSIMENIKYARLDATDEEVYEACRAAAIHDKIETFPDKYKSKVGERGVKLSGGELQRVSIARAILRRPKIVILDEATSMIDAETETVIQRAFKQLAKDRTTFVIAHRLSTIQHADQILVIHNGEVVERGTHDELFRQNGRYVTLWSKQINKEVREIGSTLSTSS